MANLLTGAQWILDQGDVGRARYVDRNLNRLAGQAMGAAGDERRALVQQATELDRGAGAELQGQLEDRDERTYRKAIGAARFVLEGMNDPNPEVVKSRYREVIPFLTELGRAEGRVPPAEFDPAMRPMLERLVAMGGEGPQGNVQSTYIDDRGQRVAIMRDGTTRVLGQAENRLQLRDQPGIAPGAFDPRTGTIRPVSEAMSAGSFSGAMPAGVDPVRDFEQLGSLPGVQTTSLYRDPERNARVGGVAGSQHIAGTAGDFVMAPEQKPGFIARARAMGYEAIDEGDHVHVELPPGASATSRFGGAPAMGGGAGVAAARPSATQDAAASEAARQRVQLEYAPAREAIETQGALDRARGTAQLESAQETSQAAPGAIATLQQSLDSIDALLGDPNLGDIVGVGSLNPLNRIPGTNARGLIARADQIAGQAFLAAFNQLKGGGAITEREGAAATAAMARLDRSQSLEDYKAALGDLKRAIEPALQRQRESLGRAQRTMGRGGAAPAASTGAAPRARNPQTGEIVELRNGQWVPVR